MSAHKTIQELQTNQCTENAPVFQFHIGTKSTHCYTPRRCKAGLKLRHCPYAPIKVAKVAQISADLTELQSIKRNLSSYKPRRNTRKKRRFSPFKHT